AFVACGGSPTSGPSGPTGPEFKLGVVLPYSGVYAELGNSITNGMRMYFDSVGNQAGNRKITMITADEQVQLADAVAATKKVVEQDGVDKIDGIYSFMSGTDAVTFLKKAYELGTLTRLALVSGAGFFVEQDVLAAITDAAPAGAITGLHWALTLPNKENQDFISKYSKKF